MTRTLRQDVEAVQDRFAVEIDPAPGLPPVRALARNDMLNAVWGNSAMVAPRSIDRCVTTLRAKIEVDPQHR